MSTVTVFGDISPRTAAYASKELLKRADPFLVISKFAQTKPLPGQNSKTIKWRRYNALSNDLKVLTEGITPAPNTFTTTDVEATLVQYGDSLVISDVIQDTHEDPVLKEMMGAMGEQAAQMMEKMYFGVMKAGSNVIYADGSARSSVVSVLSLNLQRKAVRALKRQAAKLITKQMSTGPDYNSEPVAASYIALVHPDLEPDIRTITGFVPTEKYTQVTPHASEIGKIEGVRYIAGHFIEPWLGTGSSTTTGKLNSNVDGTAKCDVYPVILMGQDAFATVALKGMYAITPMVANAKPSDSDPFAQRTKVAWKTMQTAAILNDLWMCRLEVACTSL